MSEDEVRKIRLELAEKLTNNEYGYKIPTWISAIISEVFDKEEQPVEIIEQEIQIEDQEKSFYDKIMDCNKCDIRTEMNRPVLPSGELRHYDLMIVGEAPGVEEAKLGVPFVGPSGELLQKIITKIGWKREDIFITNVIACRPPDNRIPTSQERLNCHDFLLHQFDTVQPRFLLCLGSVASKMLIKPYFKMSEDHGIVHQLADIPFNPKAMGIYHPSFLLRNENDMDLRVKVWEAVQLVDKILKEGN